MPTERVKKTIQLLLSLGLALAIVWYLYRDIDIDTLWKQVRESNWIWISLSLLIGWICYWIRGWRWTLLLDPTEGKLVRTGAAYHAVMVGYLVNLVLPRAGEVARCGVLARSHGLSVGHLLGTVILERTIDLLFFAGIVLLAFVIENQLFLELFGQLVNPEQVVQFMTTHFPLVLGSGLVLVLFLYFLFRTYREHSLLRKIRHFLRDIVTGFRRIRHLSNPLGFWLSSFAIWGLYFVTMLAVALAVESTANLSGGEVLLVMVMGTIGMIAPVQGGIGTFHALVAYILIQFGITAQDGKIFAAIIHGTQLLLVLIAGIISWILITQKTPLVSQPKKQ